MEEHRKCTRPECNNTFKVSKDNPSQAYCSVFCAQRDMSHIQYETTTRKPKNK